MAANLDEVRAARPLLADRNLRRIAVFRALHLGDLLCAVPALRALRAGAPNARIVLIGLPWARTFVDRFPRYVDELLVFPGCPGFPEQDADVARYQAFLEEARARRFDLALQMHGSGALVNDIVQQLHARLVGGFHPADRPSPGPGFITWPERGHEIDRLLQLATFAGAPSRGRSLEFAPNANDGNEATAVLRSLGARPGRYVVVHPGARLPSRRWPIDRFARVACALALDGWQIVATGTPAEAPLTHALCRAVDAAAPGRVFDAAGLTSLGGLAALIGGARVLIANDTGVSHIAAAVGTPSVIVSSGGDAQRWAPLDRDRHRVLALDLPCRPCMHVECPVGHPCATAVGAEIVIREAQALLAHGLTPEFRDAA